MGEVSASVFVWLNIGCALRLQVADSIPAQVSGFQCLLYVCSGRSHYPQSIIFLPFSGNIGMDTATLLFPLFSPPFPLPLFILIACLALMSRDH